RIRPHHPDVRLALIGEGVSRPLVEEFQLRPGLEGAIVAPGVRPFSEVPMWMGASDLVVLPSWMEGTPNVLLEALASGRPCVASDVGGIPDVLQDPRSGFVHRARDAQSLAETLERALACPPSPSEAAACGPITWDESADQLYEVLERTMSAPQVRSAVR